MIPVLKYIYNYKHLKEIAFQTVLKSLSLLSFVIGIFKRYINESWVSTNLKKPINLYKSDILN